MKKFIVVWLCACALGARAIDITSDTVVGDAAVAGYVAADVNIAAGASLTFHNISAPQTFTGRISGGGAFVVKNDNAGNTVRITFDGDATGLTGGIFVTNYLVTVTKPAAIGSSKFTLNTYVRDTLSYLNGPGVYANPLDVRVHESHPRGFTLSEGVEVAGPVTWRFGRICGPGVVTGEFKLYGQCYGQAGVHFAGGVTSSSAGSEKLHSDNGVFYIDSRVTLLGGISVTGTSPIHFGIENALDPAQEIGIGAGYNPSGIYDFHGFSQRIASINVSQTQQSNESSAGFRSETPATLTIWNQYSNQRLFGNIFGALSLDYASTANHRLLLCGTHNDTTGKLTVRSSTLAVQTNSVFSALSGIEATGSGVFEFCAVVDPTGKILKAPAFNVEKLNLSISENGKIKMPDGFVLEVNTLTVDGTPLAGGEYTGSSPELAGRMIGEGTVRVLAIAKKTEGATFTWKGGSAGDALAAAANWEGGVAPAFDGTERLVFGPGGTARAVVSGVADVFAIDVLGNVPFEFAAAGADARIVLQQGGFTLTNSVDDAKVTHAVACPVELGYVPQTWNIAPNAVFDNLAPLSGPARVTPEALTIRGRGRMCLRADNSQLHPRIIFAEGGTDASQPYVYHNCGLGSPDRSAEFHNCVPRFMNDAAVITCAVPLRIKNNTAGNAGYIRLNDKYKNDVYIDAPVTFFDVTGEVYLNGRVHFRGGVYHEQNMQLNIRFPGGDNWIDGDVGLSTTGDVAFDYDGVFNFSAAQNRWGKLMLYKSTVKLHATNTLAVSGTMQLSGNGDAYRSNTAGIDLNGFDQCIARIVNGFEADRFNTLFGTVKSDAPAVLEIARTTEKNDVVALKFRGAAGLKFNAPGSLSFTNQVSDTTGPLTVEKGTVKFCVGAGWVNATSVAVGAEGKIAIAPGAGATAFGAQQGRSLADVTLVPGGTFEIASGETAAVHTLSIDDGVKLRYQASGFYGAAGTPGVTRVADWVTGGGLLQVRASLERGTLMTLR